MIATDLFANLLPWCLQVAAIVAVASMLPWLFRLDTAGVRYVYWRAVAVLCLTLPWIQPYRDLRESAPASDATGVTVATTAVSAVARTVPHLNWEWLLLGVLALGVVVRFGWLTLGLIRLLPSNSESVPTKPMMR